MKYLLKALDQLMERRSRAEILAFAACSVLTVGGIDCLTGCEISMSLFYLVPVAAATWYAGRWGGVAIAVFSCMIWYLADLAAGSHYSHLAIPVWNALVRFGFFLTTGLLLAAVGESCRAQQYLARTDSLTGLCNRRAFVERLGHDLALAQRHRNALTLVYVDVDDFKAVNDAHGHAEGDRVLRTIGEVLRGSVRDADTAARLGGDEFALVLPDTDGPGAKHVISKLTRGLHGALGPDDRRITCSIGVVTFLESAMSSEQAVAAADQLMYRVKREAKGAALFSIFGEAASNPAPQWRVRRGANVNHALFVRAQSEAESRQVESECPVRVVSGQSGGRR